MARLVEQEKIENKKPGMLHKVGEKLGLIEKTGEIEGSLSAEQCVKSGGTWKGGKCQMKGEGKNILERQIEGMKEKGAWFPPTEKTT